jgi:hypothetical protein
VPVYPHSSWRAVSKCLTYARCQGKNWAVKWIYVCVELLSGGTSEHNKDSR